MSTVKTIWNETSELINEANIMLDLMPGTGASKDEGIELFRGAWRMYYDFNNNGCCNMIEATEQYEECDHCNGLGYTNEWCDETDDYVEEECECCGGSGEVEDSFNYQIESYYLDFVENLEANDINCDQLRSYVDEMCENIAFDTYEITMFEEIMEQVLKHDLVQAHIIKHKK